MGRSAKVTSIDAVRAFSAALRRFQEDAAAALDGTNLATQRALEWIRHDRKDYWARQVKRGYEQLGEAKANLQRCLTFGRIADHRPSCIEEKRALERAKRRLNLAQEKVETVRHWSRTADRAAIEYKGNINQLAGWLDADLPRALAALERIADALESYVAVESSVEKTPELPGTNNENMGLDHRYGET